MEFGLREWLLLLGLAFIGGVLLHGFLRMPRNRNRIRMKLDKSNRAKSGGEGSGAGDSLPFNPELPNGGARVVPGSEQVALDLQQPGSQQLGFQQFDSQQLGSQQLGSQQLDSQQFDSQQEPPVPMGVAEPPKAPASGPGASSSLEVAGRAPLVGKRRTGEQPATRAGTSASAKPEKFVVVHVAARDNAPLEGQKLVEILLESNMTFGDMNIFHRISDGNVSEFSLANSLEPGTFDMAGMGSFSTPGVTMFMRAHDLPEPVRVFDDMIDVAETIAAEFGGRVLDESRSVMTPQTLEHYRQSIQEFQFKHSA